MISDIRIIEWETIERKAQFKKSLPKTIFNELWNVNFDLSSPVRQSSLATSLWATTLRSLTASLFYRATNQSHDRHSYPIYSF